MIPPFLTWSFNNASAAVVPCVPTTSNPIASNICATESPIAGVGANDKSTIPNGVSNLFEASCATNCPILVILNAVFFSVASIGLGNGVSPSPLAVIGSLLGFLVFNVFPARVFMGDTGSLALGGFVSGMACFLRLPLFLPLVGFIYMMEILSVILQVSFFKLTKGKRIFKMTPIHHHFELMGWSETQIVTVFATITAILCLIALMGL